MQSSSHIITTNKSTPSFFTGRMPFLSPNQQCQSTEGNNIKCLYSAVKNSSLKFLDMHHDPDWQQNLIPHISPRQNKSSKSDNFLVIHPAERKKNKGRNITQGYMVYEHPHRHCYIKPAISYHYATNQLTLTLAIQTSNFVCQHCRLRKTAKENLSDFAIFRQSTLLALQKKTTD